MAEYKPLTKEERETHAAFCKRQLRLRTGNAGMAVLHDMAHLSLAYEATVKDRENRIAALEAENARLREKAELGEAVEGMRPGDVLLRASETKWRTGAGAMASTTNRSITIIHWADKVRNTALAALRAAKGEGDAH